MRQTLIEVRNKRILVFLLASTALLFLTSIDLRPNSSGIRGHLNTERLIETHR